MQLSLRRSVGGSILDQRGERIVVFAMGDDVEAARCQRTTASKGRKSVKTVPE
jgi:hypothetical protein